MSDESEDSDVDDQFLALLDGLRTTLPGVTVLFAFLLTLPLQNAFADIARADRWAYYAAFLAAALSTILLIAPAVHQRMRAPSTGVQRHSRRHLLYAVWLTIFGTMLFLVSLCAAIYLVTGLVFDPTSATIATVTVGLLAGWAWIWLPVVTFRSR